MEMHVLRHNKCLFGFFFFFNNLTLKIGRYSAPPSVMHTHSCCGSTPGYLLRVFGFVPATFAITVL